MTALLPVAPFIESAIYPCASALHALYAIYSHPRTNHLAKPSLCQCRFCLAALRPPLSRSTLYPHENHLPPHCNPHLQTVSTNNNHHKPPNINHQHHHNTTNHHQSTFSKPPSGAASPTQSQFRGTLGPQHLAPVPSVCVRVPNSPGFDSEPSSPAKTIPMGKPNDFSTLFVRE